jgi:hypothetical protein
MFAELIEGAEKERGMTFPFPPIGSIPITHSDTNAHAITASGAERVPLDPYSVLLVVSISRYYYSIVVFTIGLPQMLLKNEHIDFIPWKMFVFLVFILGYRIYF